MAPKKHIALTGTIRPAHQFTKALRREQTRLNEEPAHHLPLVRAKTKSFWRLEFYDFRGFTG